MKLSTVAVFKKHGWRIDRAIHNILYFTYYAPYVKVALVSTKFLTKYFAWVKPITPIAKAVFHRYHSKVLSKEDTKKIFTLNKNISVISDDNKKIVPYKYATKIIFQEPEHIVVMDCPCKLSTNAPQETINSCLAVGKEISMLWMEHCQKYNPRKISQSEALELIDRLRAKGHVTQAFLKVATGGSTGVICNCHPDTCVSLTASRLSKKISAQLEMNANSGYSIQIDKNKCDLGANCIDVCPVGAIKIKEGSLNYQKDKCLGCGLCAEQCLNDAISLYRDPEKTMPLDIDLLDNNAVVPEV
ncbi:MAG: 4Fe-4S binding protein [Deltaproteobacteria bacterium]|nr:4Fe-4S binding protein [Deltaproteobacteria bacterium]